MSVQGTLFIISAPSGGGKTSLVNALIKQLPGIEISVSHTTRAPRIGEVDGKNYFFVDEATFRTYQQQEIFLEYANVFNHWYGTSRQWVLERLAAGIDVVLEIDWQGALRVQARMECESIFIIPPSRETLLTRLRDRKQDSPETIERRTQEASYEIAHYTKYDYIVVNDDFETALADLVAIVRAKRLTLKHQAQRHAALLASLI